MRQRVIVSICLMAGLTACAGLGRSGPDTAATTPGSGAVPAEVRAAALQTGRSVWAVVPSAPARKQDLRPDLIAGSAVAIAPDRLLASCSAVGGRSQVGILRHNKYRIAKAAPAESGGQICALTVTNVPLTVAATFRDREDLRLGEPVYALSNKTSADVALTGGTLMAKVPSSAELKTSIMLPPRTMSAILIDGRGNLVGVATNASPDQNGTLATTLAPWLLPDLASRDLGPPRTGLLSAALSPDALGPGLLSLLHLNAENGEE